MRTLAILLIGAFLECSGQGPGSVDLTFNPTDNGYNDPATGANGPVTRVITLDDGRILIGGSCTACNGVAHGGMAHQHADGSLDASFVPPVHTVIDMEGSSWPGR